MTCLGICGLEVALKVTLYLGTVYGLVNSYLLNSKMDIREREDCHTHLRIRKS